MLGLPITRRDVVVGKLVGRLAVFSVMVLIGVTLGGMESWYLYAGFELGAYAIFVVETLLLGWVFLTIGVGFSAMFRSRPRAVSTSIGVFALVSIVWRVVPDGVFYLVNGRYPENVPPPWEPPAWFVFLGNLNPVDGIYAIVEHWVYGNPSGGTVEYRGYVVEGVDPFYLHPAFLLATILLWALVPLLIGTWRFGRSDLG